jgi:hypothetical protein
MAFGFLKQTNESTGTGVFDPGPVQVTFVVGKEELGQGLQFYPFSIIIPVLHIHFHIRTSGQSLGTFQKIMLLLKSGSIS